MVLKTKKTVDNWKGTLHTYIHVSLHNRYVYLDTDALFVD